MLLVNHYHYGEPSTPKPQRFVSLLEGHTAVLEALKAASKLEPRDLIPLSVAIEAVTFADEAAPVLYTLRVTCHTHGASWILPPRRYTNFEALHRKIKSCGAMLKASWLRQLLSAPDHAPGFGQPWQISRMGRIHAGRRIGFLLDTGACRSTTSSRPSSFSHRRARRSSSARRGCSATATSCCATPRRSAAARWRPSLS